MAFSTLIWNYFLEVNIESCKLEARARTPEWLSRAENSPCDNWRRTEREGTCTGWAGAMSSWRAFFVLPIKSKIMSRPSEVIAGIALKTCLCNSCFTLTILSFPNPVCVSLYLKLSYLVIVQNSPLENSHDAWSVESTTLFWCYFFSWGDNII